MDFKQHLKVYLGWTDDDCDSLFAKYSSEYDACQAILHPSSTMVDWDKTPKKSTFQRLEYFLKFESLGWKCVNKKMKEEISLFELEVMTKRSPFYAFTVFDVEFERCLVLAQLLNLNLSEEIFAYNLVYQEIIAHQKIGQKQVGDLLMSYDLDINKIRPIHRIEPFGRNVLHNHPLANVNVDVTPEAKLRPLVRGGDLISKIREKKSMTNRIVQDKNGDYSFQSSLDQFVSLVTKMILTPVT